MVGPLSRSVSGNLPNIKFLIIDHRTIISWIISFIALDGIIISKLTGTADQVCLDSRCPLW